LFDWVVGRNKFVTQHTVKGQKSPIFQPFLPVVKHCGNKFVLTMKSSAFQLLTSPEGKRSKAKHGGCHGQSRVIVHQ
jgi:hypothetical protein